jgi:hypothetical protein
LCICSISFFCCPRSFLHFCIIQTIKLSSTVNNADLYCRVGAGLVPTDYFDSDCGLSTYGGDDVDVISYYCSTGQVLTIGVTSVLLTTDFSLIVIDPNAVNYIAPLEVNYLGADVEKEILNGEVAKFQYDIGYQNKDQFIIRAHDCKSQIFDHILCTYTNSHSVT